MVTYRQAFLLSLSSPLVLGILRVVAVGPFFQVLNRHLHLLVQATLLAGYGSVRSSTWIGIS